MKIKEKINFLREQIKAMIKPESTPEELEMYKNFNGALDEIEKEHESNVALNAKYKDQIVNMVLSQGSSETPPDDSLERKPKSMEEFVNDFSAKHKEE